MVTPIVYASLLFWMPELPMPDSTSNLPAPPETNAVSLPISALCPLARPSATPCTCSMRVRSGASASCE